MVPGRRHQRRAGPDPWDLLPPAVPARSVAALVERGHGLVRRARLDLHEVGAVVAARRARFYEE